MRSGNQRSISRRIGEAKAKRGQGGQPAGDRGILTFRHTVKNQHGEHVMECPVKRMLKGHNFAA
jgi:acyl dehydratase